VISYFDEKNQKLDELPGLSEVANCTEDQTLRRAGDLG